MRRAVAGLVVSTVVLLAGCAAQVSGEAAPGGSGSSSSAPAPRKELDMGPGFDPCAAITSEQADRLGVSLQGPGKSSTGTRSCQWARYMSEPKEAYLVAGRDDRGIKNINTVGAPFTVGRFTAVIGRTDVQAEFDRECSIFMEVRPDQGLQVTYNYEGTSGPMTHDLACSKARPVAEMVIANLDRGGN